MSRDCTCQGLNENCMFCFGTGVVVGPRSIPPGIAFQGQKSRRRSRRSPRVQRPCPFCGRPFARLSRHLRKAHSGEASATQADRGSVGVPAVREASTKAPRETVTGKPNDGGPQEQLAQEFGKSVESPTAPAPPARFVETPGFVRCPKCHNKIKTSKLAWHLQNVDHSKRSLLSTSTLEKIDFVRGNNSGARRPKANPTAVRPEDLKNEVKQSQIIRRNRQVGFGGSCVSSRNALSLGNETSQRTWHNRESSSLT